MSINQTIQNAKVALESAKRDPTEVKAGILACSTALRSLQNNHLRRAKTVGAKQQIASAIGIVKSYHTQLKHLYLHSATGAGLQKRKRASWISSKVKWEDVETAFSGRVRTGVIINITHKEPKSFLDDCSSVFRKHVKKALDREFAVKVNSAFCGEFRIIKADKEVHELKHMNTKNVPIYRETDLGTWFEENISDVVLKKLEEFQEKESGWALSAIVNLTININKYTPQLGSSYVQLPKFIKVKHACVNVKNSDNACFAWAVVSALYPAEHDSDRVTSYPCYKDVLSLAGITFPMTIKEVPRFEKLNNVSINIYILRKNKKSFSVLPTYLTKDKKDQHINLLMIQNVYIDDDDDADDADKASYVDDEVDAITYHYVWIKNLSRLLSSQMSKNKNQKYFCDRCLHYFHTTAKLEAHMEDCIKLNSCKIRLPREEEKVISFKNFKNKIMSPFVIYADVECLLVKSSSQNAYQKHIPHSVGFYIKCQYDPSLSFYKSFRGTDCIEWFVRELNQFAEDVETVFLCPLPMNSLTTSQIHEFNSATICHICGKTFSDNSPKVRDHCHLTGVYRGPAHEGCNINFKDSHTIPIIFHNLSGYDSHFIIKNIAVDLKGRLDLLPINRERYISFTKRLDEYMIKYRFIDSFRFMGSSLDNLVSSLSTFPNVQSEFSGLSNSQLTLLTRKGVFPYDYCDNASKFFETSLPDIAQFYNKLNDVDISEEDYAHAQKVWSELNINNLGEYSDLYLKTDVILLADIFEQFRASCHKTYGLDPAHYFTLPGYTWDAMLKYTDVTLELLTDVDMLMFVERGIRGGLSQCSKRYSKANNAHMLDFDESLPTKHLIYFDINNQYGWAMSQYLPHSGFNWVEDLENFNVEDVADDSDIGYILEVDLDYPSEIHDQHKDLPCCPDHAAPTGSKAKKLLATLQDKKKYIIHFQTLKQALKYGLKLSKIHRILKFNQSPWLKSYIDLNTVLRTAAKNNFDKDLYKLMNNAIFGKTMENIRKHSIVKLVTRWLGRYGAESYISKPEFKARTIFSEELVAIELNKTEIFFNKPIYVGMCILDLAKTTIYDFHYGYMIPQFGHDCCSVCYTDTDSLIYEVTGQDLYKFIGRDCHKYFDTSDYPQPNPWGIPSVNKKVLGLMKDENNGRVMTEFAGLRSKMYAIRVEGKDAAKKSKGVKRNIVKNRIKFDDYVYCLNSGEEKTIDQNLIHSQKHEVSSIIQTKIALSPHDDKRYLISGSYETLPWGHYSIMNKD